jgi:uncharacterized protein
MYREGRGVPKDVAEAEKWYRRLADEQGDASTQYFLGYLYEQGDGWLQNYAEAVKWYRRAAEQGDVMAQVALGKMYAIGKGVTQDDVGAHMWFNLAALRDQGAAELRDKVAAHMTAAQIAEAQKLASEWKQKPER